MLHRRTWTLLIAIVMLVGACAAGSGATTPPTARPETARPATPAPTTRPTPTTPPRASAPAGGSGFLYDPNADAKADVAAAFTAAKASGKRVLIDYGADWCPDCHSLAAYMEGAAGTALIDRSFEVVRVDVGYWDHNLDVAGQYGDAIAKGIPAVVVYAADGKLIGSSADGSLASARGMSEAEVLAKLAAWAK